MRIEPRHPPPPINFVEWDGFIKICFSRKNKTLGAIFKQPSTLALLHRNYELCKALSAAADGGATDPKHAATTPSLPVDMTFEDVDVDEDGHSSDGDEMDIDSNVAVQVIHLYLCLQYMIVIRCRTACPRWRLRFGKLAGRPI